MSSAPPPEDDLAEARALPNGTVCQLFQRQAASTPDAVAVVYRDRTLTYQALDALSDRLASHLRNIGVTRETLVGVFLGRSEWLPVTLLAILKASGAYVPLDPSHPAQRLALIIADSGAQYIITNRDLASQLPANPAVTVFIDAEELSTLPGALQLDPHLAAPADLVYVMYTSGSTGRPKGVMIEHGNVANLFAGMDRLLGTAPGVWLAVTGVAFDISVLELLWTLTRGFTVVVHGDGGVNTVANAIIRHKVTHLQMTPSLARLLTFNDRMFSSLGLLKQLLLGGETLPASLVQKIRTVFSGDLLNMYGPTETTIWSTAFRIDSSESTVAIGKPILNTQVYLLDENLVPVPQGESGEIAITGEGLARGYWNQPQLTAERFVALPAMNSARGYLTGDLGRMRPDGNIEFLGRLDNQVKVRGHRIELGEIEAALELHASVRQAVIVLREGKDGDLSMIACLLALPECDRSVDALRSHLRLRLPEAMVPSTFIFLDEMPLNPNGKIDRKSLLAISLDFLSSLKSEHEYENQVERTVAHVWQEVLEKLEVGLDANFFDLGANSLIMAEAFAKLQNAYGSSITLLDLFEFPTVRALARHLAVAAAKSGDDQLAERAKQRRLAQQR